MTATSVADDSNSQKYLYGALDGVVDAAKAVSHSVGGVISDLKSGVGGVVNDVTGSVGGIMNNATSGMKRFLSTRPSQYDLTGEEETPGIVYRTPQISVGDVISRTGSWADFEKDQDEALDSELGLHPDHFTQTEDPELEQSIAGLERAVELCKNLILNCDEASTRRRLLVHKLIRLRLRLQDAKEEAEIEVTGVKCIMGHMLHPFRHLSGKSKKYCDKCAQIIWGIVHSYYICSLCEYQCHGRCVNAVNRRCASLKVAEDPTFILRICPEVGLSAQNFRCADCRILMTEKNAWCEPRRCDYTGLYYCPACHWNSPQVMPGRVVHNWDFEERPVSRQSKQFLRMMRSRPVLCLEKINSQLFTLVDELSTVKKLREDLLMMKVYLSSCRTAHDDRLLLRLQDRQHFVESVDMYSLQDLIDTNSGFLVDYLKEICNAFMRHIKVDCLACRGKAFICELCDAKETVFPFDSGVISCQSCRSVYHFGCFSNSAGCPKCLRQELRKVRCRD